MGLKERWKIQSTSQLIIILIVFSINGSIAAYLMKPVLTFLGISKDIGWYFYWPLASILILPVYFVLLLIIGWIFGQYKFFYNFEKKSLSRMGLGFLFRDKEVKE
ncbi:MAG: DUF6787 family protein [Brumimicrobium sp.]